MSTIMLFTSALECFLIVCTCIDRRRSSNARSGRARRKRRLLYLLTHGLASLSMVKMAACECACSVTWNLVGHDSPRCNTVSAHF